MDMIRMWLKVVPALRPKLKSDGTREMPQWWLIRHSSWNRKDGTPDRIDNMPLLLRDFLFTKGFIIANYLEDTIYSAALSYLGTKYMKDLKADPQAYKAWYDKLIANSPQCSKDPVIKQRFIDTLPQCSKDPKIKQGFLDILPQRSNDPKIKQGWVDKVIANAPQCSKDPVIKQGFLDILPQRSNDPVIRQDFRESVIRGMKEAMCIGEGEEAELKAAYYASKKERMDPKVLRIRSNTMHKEAQEALAARLPDTVKALLKCFHSQRKNGKSLSGLFIKQYIQAKTGAAVKKQDWTTIKRLHLKPGQGADVWVLEEEGN